MVDICTVVLLLLLFVLLFTTTTYFAVIIIIIKSDFNSSCNLCNIVCQLLVPLTASYRSVLSCPKSVNFNFTTVILLRPLLLTSYHCVVFIEVWKETF